MKARKLGKTVLGPEITLGGLWQSWMDLNDFDISQAQACLKTLGIIGGNNLPQWLNDHSTVSLLTTMTSKIIEKTGIDIDAWIVCQSKKQVIASHPELSEHIKFDRMIHRIDYVNALKSWTNRYSSYRFVALQLRLSPTKTRNWIENRNLPSIDLLPYIIEGMARGLIETDSREDVIYVMMCRVIFGMEPQDVFDGARTFGQAVEMLLAPLRKHTLVRVASETDLGESIIKSLRGYNSTNKSKLPYETIEKVVRALIKKEWPDLVEVFDQHRTVYREDEDKRGFWYVEKPMKNLIDTANGRLSETIDEVDSLVDTDSEVKSQPDVSTQHNRKSSSLHVEVVSEIEKTLETPQDDLRGIFADTATYLAKRLRGELTENNSSSQNVRSVVSKTNSDTRTTKQRDPIAIGSTVSDVENCLDRFGYIPRTGERLSKKQIYAVVEMIGKLRKVLVCICELDPSHIQSDLRPVLGPELFELFLAGKGMKHLLHSDAAWDIIEAERMTVTEIFGQNKLGER